MIKNANTYMRMAKLWADNSTSKRNKVGCLIVKNNMIISDGYNGTPRGFDNNCEYLVETKLVTKPEVLHAESNAIAKLATSNTNCSGASLFTTLAPCWDCAKLIVQCQIKEVYYTQEYSTKEGIVLLNRASIATIKLDA
tara:strand:- start:2175 stop:2591 length:417 start_codon:yes stop_codon:yes gene_type:complete